MAALAAGGVFVLLQALLSSYDLRLIRAAIARGLDQPSSDACLGHCLWQVLPGAILTYAGFALAGVVVAAAGRRILCALPACVYVLYFIAQGAHALQPIGAQWGVPCYERCPAVWFGAPWVGALTDLVLVLIPAVAVAWSVPSERWPGVLDTSAVASIGLAVGLMALAYQTTSVVDQRPSPHLAVAVAAFALAAGVRRPWWPWSQVVWAATVSGVLAFVSWDLMGPPFSTDWAIGKALAYDAEYLLPLAAIAVLGSTWGLLAPALRKAVRRPVALLVAVNVLNIVDAVFTGFAVHSGGATELNPVIRVAGLPVKLVAVGALSALLLRRRPVALVWPLVVLLWVLCYQVSGLVVNG